MQILIVIQFLQSGGKGVLHSCPHTSRAKSSLKVSPFRKKNIKNGGKAIILRPFSIVYGRAV
jgi:hypothetical protein